MSILIYKITNLINGKIYVGQTTKTVEERFKKHATADSLIGRAIRKYGKENFKPEVIAECESVEEANELEKYWIKTLNCKAPEGYNLTDGGEGRRGCTHTFEARVQLSMAVRNFYLEHPEAGKAHSEFLKKYYEENPDKMEKLADLHRGKKDSDETRVKKSASLKKFYTEHPEAKLKHSEDMKKRYQNPEEREKTSAQNKKRWSNPEARKKQSERMKARWEKIREQRERENND